MRKLEIFEDVVEETEGWGQSWVYMLEDPRMNLSAVRDS